MKDMDKRVIHTSLGRSQTCQSFFNLGGVQRSLVQHLPSPTLETGLQESDILKWRASLGLALLSIHPQLKT